MTPMRCFVIRDRTTAGTGQETFWSNEIGWVDLEGATVFSAREKDVLTLPVDGEWLDFQPPSGK